MYGTVEGNELKAIAGLSDGTTSIVHRAADSNYAIPLAVDNQYGAGYVGISDCCKFLFNPFTGIAIVDCIDTTVTCVDINTNSNTCEQQRLLVQGFDNEGNLDNKIELTNICYNANCYVCNDASGNPVRKPVLHIGTACIDELLGIEQGATVECWCCGTDTNEGRILFTCDDGTGTTIYYDTNLSYNTTGGVLVSRSVATHKISPYNYDNNNEAYIMLNKCHVTIDGNSRNNCAPSIRVSDGDICVNGCSYQVWVGNSNAYMNIAANGNTSITAPSFSMSATCTYMSLPNALTCVNLMARDHASGQVVEVPEVVYNPTTCELCGKFVPTGGIAVCPTTTSAWYNIVINCDTADGLKYSETTHRIAADPDTGRIFASGGLTSDGGPVVKAESTNELNIYPVSGDAIWINYRSGVVCTYIGNGSGVLGTLCADRLLAKTEVNGPNVISNNVCAFCWDVAEATNLPLVKAVTTTAGYGYNGGAYLGHYNPAYDGRWGFATVGFYNNETATPTANICMAREGGVWTYGETHIGSAGNLYVDSGHAYALRNGTWQEYALACDMPSGSNSREIDPASAAITSVVGMVNVGETVFVNGYIAAYTVTFGDGQSVTFDYLLGFAHRQGGCILFTGTVRQYGTSKALNATLWFDSSAVDPTWSSIQRPGTLYGSASSSGINVEGTV